MNGRAFKRRSVLDHAPGSGVPNMTPMVDVTLVILIFFMASATIAGPEWFLRAGLPDEPVSSALGLPSPVVRIEVYLGPGGARVRGFAGDQSLDEAVRRVRGLEPSVAAGLVVEIETSDSVAYADLVTLHGALAERGVAVRLR